MIRHLRRPPAVCSAWCLVHAVLRSDLEARRKRLHISGALIVALVVVAVPRRHCSVLRKRLRVAECPELGDQILRCFPFTPDFDYCSRRCITCILWHAGACAGQCVSAVPFNLHGACARCTGMPRVCAGVFTCRHVRWCVSDGCLANKYAVFVMYLCRHWLWEPAKGLRVQMLSSTY
jgi:hypothetical protein